MMKRLLIHILIIVSISVSTAWGAIEFIYPSPKSSVTSPGHLIFKLNKSDVSSLRITHNGFVADPVEVGTPEYRKLFQDFFIAQSFWDQGVNKLTVDLINGGQKIESAELNMFYAPKGSDQAIPPEYPPVTMHRPENERLCQSCHTMNPSAAQINSSVEKNNPCIRCHKQMLTVKYLHGPVGTFSCGYCHAAKGKPKYSVPKSGSALCYECHADMAVQMGKLKFVHGPIDAGMCQDCHDPHGSQNESHLVKPVNELCLSCHAHIRKQKHVVRTSGGEGHPLSGKSDPSKKASGRQMSCVSCHAPHGSDVRYFFVNNADDRMSLCQMCHNK